MNPLQTGMSCFRFAMTGLMASWAWAASAANPVYVDDDYTNVTPGWGLTHFATIQDGVNAVDTGGMVMVEAGTYPGSVTVGKALTLKSLGAAVVTGDSASAILVAADGVTIEGFTIRNPNSVHGVYAYTRSHLTVINNTIENIATSVNSPSLAAGVLFVSNISSGSDSTSIVITNPAINSVAFWR